MIDLPRELVAGESVPWMRFPAWHLKTPPNLFRGRNEDDLDKRGSRVGGDRLDLIDCVDAQKELGQDDISSRVKVEPRDIKAERPSYLLRPGVELPIAESSANVVDVEIEGEVSTANKAISDRRLAYARRAVEVYEFCYLRIFTSPRRASPEEAPFVALVVGKRVLDY